MDGHSPSIDPNATGAAEPLPAIEPGIPGRESHERDAALQRGQSLRSAVEPLCAPDLPGLEADLIYTLVAENVRDYAIFLMDADGIIRCWGESARLMKWWTKQQAEGAHLRLLYPDGGSEDGLAETHLSTAAESGEYNGEGHRVRSDGSTFWAYVTLTALRSPDGRLVGFTKVTRDFSARRAVESALIGERSGGRPTIEDVNRMKRTVATFSHELRNPLNAILGSVALLERQIPEAHLNRAHLDRLQRNTRHLMAIADDILEMSRAESRQLTLARQSVVSDRQSKRRWPTLKRMRPKKT